MTDNKTSLFAFYDLNVSPLSFDFLSFAIVAERARRNAGLECINFVFVPIDRGDGHHDNKQFDSQHGDWRFNNVILPICDLLPSSAGFTVCGSTEYASYLLSQAGGNVFPESYSIEAPIERHHTGWSVLASHMGENVQYLEAPQQARSYARQWIENHAGGKKCVALTLREAPFLPNRNSDPKVWGDFARRLIAAGYYPVILRDIDTALDLPPPEYEGIPMFPEGAFNLTLRIGFYEECHICAFVTNGPAQVCFYNRNVRYLYQLAGDWLDRDPTPFNRMGIEFGETPPFANGFQRWIWSTQNCDRLMAECERLDGDIERAGAEGNVEEMLEPVAANRIPLPQIAERFHTWARRSYFTSAQEVELAEASLEFVPADRLTEKERLLRLLNLALGSKSLDKAAALMSTYGDKFEIAGEYYVQLGVIYEAKGDFEKAIEYYQNAITGDGPSPEVLYRLASSYKSLGQLEKSIEIFEALIDTNTTYKDLFLALGQAYEELGKPELALNCYQTAEERGILDPELIKRKLALSTANGG